MRAGADVVFQATFFDGSLVGFADFLMKQPDGSYAVWDTKLARHAKVSALLQLAAYGDQLQKYQIPVAPVATLKLGDRSESGHPMPDLLPVFRERREQFLALTGAHRAQPLPVAWLQEGISYCGRCDYCAQQMREHRDLLLVNGMSASQRRKLMAQGLNTIDDLATMPSAAATGPLARLRDQARMQLGLESDVVTVVTGVGAEAHPLSYKVLPTVSKLPAPNDGDIFFDFEGDPLWQDPTTEKWGIEYLFGSIEAPVPDAAQDTPEVFKPFWAHSRMEEREAFLAFLDYVEKRRANHPEMHVYHYAPYEKSAMRNLSVLHAAGEDIVDEWLRAGLLVNLLDTVRQSVRISESSYSIKKLEPFYMGASTRSGDVKDAGASVVAYADYCEARDAGLAGDTTKAAKAQEILASISDYNEYDCLSTLRLRDWLFEIGAATIVPQWTQGSGKLDVPETKESSYEPTEDELRLQAFINNLAESKGHVFSDDERAIEMVAAAASYHRREDKQFWWGHFDRLGAAVDDWSEERNLFQVQLVEELSDWEKASPRARTESRTLRLTGIATEGSDFRAGTSWFGMFNAPLPDGMADEGQDPTQRGGLFNITIVDDAVRPRNTGCHDARRNGKIHHEGSRVWPVPHGLDAE
ncbi:TM0106 family RecB-like putative nuclease [Arthrobacter psychrolactophilus]